MENFNIFIKLDDIPEYIEENRDNLIICCLTKGELIKYAEPSY